MMQEGECMKGTLVFQSDFGLSDGAVSAMYGVAHSVDSTIRLFDLTHDISPFNIWEGSYRLHQTAGYWPEGTVFVSVVDPGVGSGRRSVAVKTEASHYIVTPDNGTLTHVKKYTGIIEARQIDESINRLPGSEESYTFHGRDIYAYMGAKLAAGIMGFEEVGASLSVDSLVQLPNKEASIIKDQVCGMIEILDIRFGNVWTNISHSMMTDAGIRYGDRIETVITQKNIPVYKQTMFFGRSFADSLVGEPLLYINSLDNIGIAINQRSFAQTYHIETGIDWELAIRKI
jgi:S-adenosylmethionine hydrolase